jgi:hypothetical protein
VVESPEFNSQYHKQKVTGKSRKKSDTEKVLMKIIAEDIQHFTKDTNLLNKENK